MERKTPAANGRGVEKLAGILRVLNTPMTYQVQHLIARHALPPQTAALVAALAFGGGYA